MSTVTSAHRPATRTDRDDSPHSNGRWYGSRTRFPFDRQEAMGSATISSLLNCSCRTQHGAPMSAHRLGFRSLSEEVGSVDLPITGKLPHWLDGALLRTGPALFEVENSRYRHWFDGL